MENTGGRLVESKGRYKKGYSEVKYREVLEYKRKMCRYPTKHEKIFFKVLKQCGEKVVKQKIFIRGKTAYITDFYIPKLKLVFEVDGKTHEGQEEYDARRTAFINTYGVKVVRYKNEEVHAGKVLQRRIQDDCRIRLAEIEGKTGILPRRLWKKKKLKLRSTTNIGKERRPDGVQPEYRKYTDKYDAIFKEMKGRGLAGWLKTPDTDHVRRLAAWKAAHRRKKMPFIIDERQGVLEAKATVRELLSGDAA